MDYNPSEPAPPVKFSSTSTHPTSTPSQEARRNSTGISTGSISASAVRTTPPLRQRTPSAREETSTPAVGDDGPPDPSSLLRLAGGVVKSRNGQVLSRGYILKSDFQAPSIYPVEGSSLAATQDVNDSIHLRGAPNFRTANLGVFGTGQPSLTGVRTILTVLKSHPSAGKPSVWFCTREEPVLYIGSQPFVLRDSLRPTTTYSLSDRAENLEAIEKRLKQDVIAEAARYGGLILVQEEAADQIRNTWVAADSVRTLREVFEEVQKDGYSVTYYRVPISRNQSPEDRYLDTYTEILSTVPTTASLVFNCGVGIVRTTFAMTCSLIVRRRQLIAEGLSDPYHAVAGKHLEDVGKQEKERALTERNEQAARDKSLLRLMQVMTKSLATKGQPNMLSLLSSQPQLLENLRNALLGNYDLILSLLSCIDDGVLQKRIVDHVIDSCDSLVNLRETILQSRVRYASSALDENASREHRARATAALERYFFLIAYTSFVNDPAGFTVVKFSTWLQSRVEIGKMISRLRKTEHFFVFAPVQDLSLIAKGDAGALSASNSLSKVRFADVQRDGGDVVGSEWAQQIVRNRSGIILRAGMILKNDQWPSSPIKGQATSLLPIRGAINFRRAPDSSLYALSQPTQDAIERVLETVRQDMPADGNIVWINLREEPLIYICGSPYVLRQEAVSLRNVKSYAGISSSRLELLEDRLKSDVIAELKSFDGRLLLHDEADGSVNPVWSLVDESSVKTLREIMDDTARKLSTGPSFKFVRVPITAEKSPDFFDVKEIVAIVAQLDLDKSAVIVNCQLGRGRSTRAQILISLVQRWLRAGGRRFPSSPQLARSQSYTVINNLLRVIQSGQEIKCAVDSAISACGAIEDLLDSIEDSRHSAEDATDDQVKKYYMSKGIQNLRAYYFLIVFASFLNETKAETWRELLEMSSYEAYVKTHPVFKTIERELDTEDQGVLAPLEKLDFAGVAFTDEVAEFVSRRKGRILSAFTLLKSDFFAGLQKMSLPERIEGAPNFRQAHLTLADDEHDAPSELNPTLFGCGMPTLEGLRRALERMGAREKLIVWTSMREEPTIYMTGRPHVLRLFDAPLQNVVTTGINSETVEAMEVALKIDILQEAASNMGLSLLHDEIQEEDGSFTITANWEAIKPADVLTPKEVFAIMRSEGFQVDYARLPVTDEQAPIPGIYTAIESRIASALVLRNNDVGFAYNCQMGRGRTSTGMTACALVKNILYSDRNISQLSELMQQGYQTTNMVAWDGRDSEPYLQGEYKVILQLVGVMQHGKLAKMITDRSIDEMADVQNLRKAVYDFKLRAEAAISGSEKSNKIVEVALQYLHRYCTLVIFAEYLLEKGSDLEERKEVPPFRKWLDDRREISHILDRKTLE